MHLLFGPAIDTAGDKCLFIDVEPGDLEIAVDDVDTARYTAFDDGDSSAAEGFRQVVALIPVSQITGIFDLSYHCPRRVLTAVNRIGQGPAAWLVPAGWTGKAEGGMGAEIVIAVAEEVKNPL